MIFLTHSCTKKKKIANGNGLKLDLKRLRDDLNLSSTAEDNIEYLYAHSHDGDRRWSNLVSYLNFMLKERPETLLVGEAPGYRGTSVTGVPFLSEGMIKERRINKLRLPFTEYIPSSMYDQASGFEATSSAMWSVLDAYCPQRLPLLWAVFPNHPHIGEDLLTNRKPTKNEIDSYSAVTRMLLRYYKIKHIVAIGNVSYDTLNSSSDNSVIKLRHPARGGAKKFSDGFASFMETTYGRSK